MSAAAAAKPAKKSSNLDTLAPISAAAGATAIAMYPVDVVRALKMASASGPAYSIREFVATHGVKGLMSQGVVPEVIRATWMRVLKFFFFPITHEAMWGVPTSKGTPIQKGLAGAVAVVPEVLTITTLELAKIGLQLDKDKKYANSIGKLVKDVYSRQGFAGCMVGWQGVQMRQSLWTGTYFATLDYFKKLSDKALSGMMPEKTPKKAAVVDFAAGFLAGVAGAVANTPVDVVRTNIQKLGLSPNPPAGAMAMAVSPGPMITLGKEIVAAKGFGGLYAGFGFKALHMGGSGAFVAMLIPIFSRLMGVNKSIM